MQPEDTGGKTHFEICTGKASLHQGYLRVRRNGGIAGGDGQTIEQFGKGLQVRLDALSQALREGTYNPRAYRSFTRPKKSGGHRVLRIPGVRDRVVMSAVAQFLMPRAEKSI